MGISFCYSLSYGVDDTAAVASAYTVSGLQTGVAGAFLGELGCQRLQWRSERHINRLRDDREHCRQSVGDRHCARQRDFAQ